MLDVTFAVRGTATSRTGMPFQLVLPQLAHLPVPHFQSPDLPRVPAKVELLSAFFVENIFQAPPVVQRDRYFVPVHHLKYLQIFMTKIKLSTLAQLILKF